jgi:hypothetical protein
LPEQTPLRLALESIVAFIAWVLACERPLLGARLFGRIEAFGGKLARRRTLAILLVGLAAPAIRLALLPWAPVPEPCIHDEFSHLLAGDTFASGRLTNPTHPMWVHFETFHVSHKPTYMSMYPPGQGMFLALGERVFGHPWFGVVLSVGLMCAAICWAFYGWFPPGWALLGGLLVVLRLGIFTDWMNSYFGSAVSAMGGALVVGALPRLMRRPRALTAVVFALGLVLLGNSRPFEAMLIALPAIVALAIWGFGKHAPSLRTLAGRIAVPALLILIPAALAMGYYNWRVYGNAFTPPYQANRATYAVAPVFIWQSPLPAPLYRHPAMRDFYLNWELKTFLRSHTLAGFFNGIVDRFGAILFYYLTPVAALAFIMLPRVLRDRRVRYIVWATAFFLAGLLLNAFVSIRYMGPACVLIYAITIQAMRHLRQWRNGDKRSGQFLVRAIPVGYLVLCFFFISPIPFMPNTGLARASLLRYLEHLPGRQLVIVRYAPDHQVGMEWVYNAADIDHSPVVWARDMGPRDNAELLTYFKDRKVWIVEPDTAPVRLSPYRVP